ncbi:response regulator transcription factor [Sinanaerobacter sp. ZZT-01]|uniref:response regulator transcription factor n=1 Tax=Sinanaerobacter sp. ZZT-01 TaxID=3111540 RepID=UPI002D7A129E|nr:response regulator transcription factor [Sinanaerobacter sp. ZZT-01]WRR92448.1 response regulator transcription factor [Sinanaerobacter sp. ZZT-01]
MTSQKKNSNALSDTILIIEDDKSIARFLTVSLETNGYKTLCADTGISGISHYFSANPALILLDLGLPDIDGFEVLSQIREKSDTPVIIVSARDQEFDKVNALDNGADDYITKPFFIGELLARVRVALRKRQPKAAEDIFQLDEFQLDYKRRKVFVNGNEVHLTPIEYRLLHLLVSHSGQVLTHAYIIKNIWGYEEQEDSQSLRVFMANLRRKIEKNTASPRYLLTEMGVGYRFVDE